MSLILLFLPHAAGGITALEYRNVDVPIITAHVYKLSFKVYSNLAQQLNVIVQNSAQSVTSLNKYKVITANAWNTIQFEFTGGATDPNSLLRIVMQAAVQETRFDKFRMIDYTIYKKSYRIMRIQGSMFPGSFIQTLTLREVTDAEIA